MTHHPSLSLVAAAGVHPATMLEIRLFVVIVCMTSMGKLTRTYETVNTRLYVFAKSQTDCRHFATRALDVKKPA
ncbi:hypothetical protein ACEU07_08980 [Chromobacterium violaceum]|uniref:hypothetical protein n=1 Tax=Chromobacterium violaceum TaxID=536 RepID=UPI001B4C3649|nr:hypothetical protein [Chromobacterium violaceum]